MTKSQSAVLLNGDYPGCRLGQVSTVKMDGSGWSKETVFIVLKCSRLYRYGV